MNVHLPLECELCPFDLTPVTSTAIQMVIGDTVAIALMSARNLTREEYAANHPAGRIGKSSFSSLVRVCVLDTIKINHGLLRGRLVVIDDAYHLISGESIFKLSVGEMFNRKPRTIDPDSMAVDATKTMEAPPSPVQFFPVINDQNILIGIVTLHGLV